VTGRATTSRQHGPLGTGHLFGNRLEGTGSPKSPSAENVRLRVGRWPRATLTTSNLTGVTGRSSCNTRTPKAYVFVTTKRIGITIDPAKRPKLPRIAGWRFQQSPCVDLDRILQKSPAGFEEAALPAGSPGCGLFSGAGRLTDGILSTSAARLIPERPPLAGTCGGAMWRNFHLKARLYQGILATRL
jgi:hypothetical protein